MPYIYKITNTKNDKVYIGKTLDTIKNRWMEHCHDYKKERCENRPLYAAMRKHGVENFSIEVVEECDASILSEREKYWIEYFGSFKYGYNATEGGDGAKYIDYDSVISTYRELQNQKKTADLLGISTDTVRKVLQTNNIAIMSVGNVIRRQKGISINMLSLSGDYIRTFQCTRDALRFLELENGRKYNGSAVDHILDVCKGKRKTAYKYMWRFADTTAS